MNQNKSVKKAIEVTKPGKSWIPSLECCSKEINSRIAINNVATAYYENLFDTNDIRNWQPTTIFNKAEIPIFLESEIASLSKSKLFNRIISENQIPTQSLHSAIVLIFIRRALKPI
ncbi:hypothetical protein ACFFRR_001206 [Megaselia abdita]